MAVNIAVILICLAQFLPGMYSPYLLIFSGLFAFSVLATLAVSWYVYDYAGIYNLDWLKNSDIQSMVNINAGFDETSAILAAKYPTAQLTVFDFYDPALHTEISIARARKAYPAYPGTLAIKTTAVPLHPGSTDIIFAIFAAHEIRDRTERIQFFTQLKTALSPNGKIILLEHLRDAPNFLAYNIGFLHFFSKNEWQRTFKDAGLAIQSETKLTPFLSIFTLQNGTTV